MKTKTIKFVPAFLALLAIGFSYFSLWCTGVGEFCYRTILDSLFIEIINPLYFFSLFFLPIALLLIFVSRETFASWLKLAAWALPLAAIFVALTPVSPTGYMDFYPFYRDDAARLAGQLFSLASFILILYKFLDNRSKPV